MTETERGLVLRGSPQFAAADPRASIREALQVHGAVAVVVVEPVGRFRSPDGDCGPQVFPPGTWARVERAWRWPGGVGAVPSHAWHAHHQGGASACGDWLPEGRWLVFGAFHDSALWKTLCDAAFRLEELPPDALARLEEVAGPAVAPAVHVSPAPCPTPSPAPDVPAGGGTGGWAVALVAVLAVLTAVAAVLRSGSRRT